MYNHLYIILIFSNFILLTTCLIIHKQRTKDREEICVKNQFRTITPNYLRLCYINNHRDHSILVWFTIDETLLNIFHAYRFVLRSIDELSLATTNIHNLTNFTKLIDLNNSLHVLNLDLGQYEICVDFQSTSTSYIYSPRTGCITIRNGDLINRSFKQSTQLFIALITVILCFLIIGIIIEWMKEKPNESANDEKVKAYEHRTKTTKIFSTSSLKRQQNQITKKLFRHRNDQSNISSVRQWILDRALHHRVSIQEKDVKISRQIERKNKQRSSMKKTNSEKDQSSSTNNVYTIPMDRFSFYLTQPGDFELV